VAHASAIAPLHTTSWEIPSNVFSLLSRLDEIFYSVVDAGEYAVFTARTFDAIFLETHTATVVQNCPGAR
jgi:hypothetical protein